MRKLFFAALLLLLVPIYSQAQTDGNWGAFLQKLNAKPFAGKRFRVEAAVRVDRIDSLAEAEIWVRVDKQNHKIGFFNNMTDRPVRSSNWQVVSIEGRIDKGADSIVFGGIYMKKGTFLFDRFRFFVEATKDKFEEIPIANAGFEDATLAPGWRHSMQQTGYVLATTTDNPYEGAQACKVDGSNLKEANYGSNDSVGKYATVNGIKLYYEEYGAGEPLLLLHGNSQSIAAFAQQIPEFAKHYKVIAVDTRGQGKSTEDGKTYTYDLFAQDMNAFLDYLHLDSVRILGWSDGGNTSLIMAMKYPRKVKQLVTMGANIFIDHSVIANKYFEEVDRMLKDLANDTTAKGRNEALLTVMLIKEPNYRFDDLKTIHCPVLVMAGQDDIIKEGHTKGIAQHISNSTLIIAPKETHFYPVEDAAGFNKTVLDYLLKKYQ